MVVEIWSDIACPWCYVGKRRFEAALAGFDHEVEVVWRSFELDPGAPASREVSAAEHLSASTACRSRRRSGRARRSSRRWRPPTASSSTSTACSRPRRSTPTGSPTSPPPTGGRTRWSSGSSARFTDGELLSDHATLARLADELGVPGAAEMLASDRYTAEVRDDERLAQDVGITAVPTFVVDRRVAVAGAQQPEVLRELLQRGVPVS